jgi:hypothetical protein
MKIKCHIITILLLICTINPVLSQSRYIYYVHIQNKDYIPVISNSKDGDGFVSVSSTITSFNRVLEKYRFYEFVQAFPTAHTDWLREVFYVVSNINVQNVTVTFTGKLILDASGNVTINSPFEVQAGGVLEVK